MAADVDIQVLRDIATKAAIYKKKHVRSPYVGSSGSFCESRGGGGGMHKTYTMRNSCKHRKQNINKQNTKRPTRNKRKTLAFFDVLDVRCLRSEAPETGATSRSTSTGRTPLTATTPSLPASTSSPFFSSSSSSSSLACASARVFLFLAESRREDLPDCRLPLIPSRPYRCAPLLLLWQSEDPVPSLRPEARRRCPPLEANSMLSSDGALPGRRCPLLPSLLLLASDAIGPWTPEGRRLWCPL